MSLPSIFLGVVSSSNRGLIKVGSGLDQKHLPNLPPRFAFVNITSAVPANHLLLQFGVLESASSTLREKLPGDRLFLA